MEHKIFVSVQGGVAEVCEETVPAGIVVEILASTTSLRIPKENSPCGLQNSESTGQRTTRNGVAVATIAPVESRE